jgi:type IV pilus assembly protein PilZ
VSGRSTIEQRVASRVPIRVKVEYERLDDFLDDYTANVSLGGMFVRSDVPLPIGTRFRLRFRVPGRDKPVETFGTVTWVVPEDHGGLVAGMGLKFDDLAPTDRRAVERWLVEADQRED